MKTLTDKEYCFYLMLLDMSANVEEVIRPVWDERLEMEGNCLYYGLN
jgi:hypothetical protein